MMVASGHASQAQCRSRPVGFLRLSAPLSRKGMAVRPGAASCTPFLHENLPQRWQMMPRSEFFFRSKRVGASFDNSAAHFAAKDSGKWCAERHVRDSSKV